MKLSLCFFLLSGTGVADIASGRRDRAKSTRVEAIIEAFGRDAWTRRSSSPMDLFRPHTNIHDEANGIDLISRESFAAHYTRTQCNRKVAAIINEYRRGKAAPKNLVKFVNESEVCPQHPYPYVGAFSSSSPLPSPLPESFEAVKSAYERINSNSFIKPIGSVTAILYGDDIIHRCVS